ncbi:MAG: Unknown protein [uncultured Thiotrichaceae bacterium]|uniref:Peptidase C39 domain-containing protein n=1 Tax=uncultured Thiotrichaceae bacterium TaxID=298394 RepID=A0A6S6U104_9GAMM|nr:MAG: Unknown protein [uncultured Thiotrichaceae bacterium]
MLIAIGVTGCTGQMSARNTLSWYVGQGTKLDDCGPASAAMAVNWAGGKSSLRHARAVTRDSGWWLFKDIATHLQQQGIATEQVKLRELRTLLAQGHGALMRISVLGIPHYVFVSDLNAQDQLLVADPLQGKKRISIRRLERKALDKVMLAVHNTLEHPVSQFDLNNIPWARSKRATVKIPKRNTIEQHRGFSHLY